MRHSEAEGRRISDGDAILRFAQDDENRVFSRLLTEHFEDMRRKRNDLTYEVEVLLTRSESKEALQAAIELVSKALEDIKAKNPQMELKFEIKKF